MNWLIMEEDELLGPEILSHMYYCRVDAPMGEEYYVWTWWEHTKGGNAQLMFQFGCEKHRIDRFPHESAAERWAPYVPEQYAEFTRMVAVDAWEFMWTVDWREK